MYPHAAVHSAGGDSSTLAKSLIMAVEDVAHDWYMSQKPLSIKTWQQAKIELLATFQGFQTEKKSTRDLLKIHQPDGEPLSKYLERLIQLRAQVPSASDDVVIAAAIEGLAIGPCASQLTRQEPSTVRELFEEIRKFAKSEDDLHRRKAARNSYKQNTPRQTQPNSQRNAQYHPTVNNLQEESAQSAPGYTQENGNQFQQGRGNSHQSRGGRPPRGGRGRGRGRTQKAPYCFVCGENAGHVSRECKYGKMAKEQKERDEASQSSEAPKHIFHNSGREANVSHVSVHLQSIARQQQFHSTPFPYHQAPYFWQHQPYNQYHQFGQGQAQAQSAAVSSQQ